MEPIELPFDFRDAEGNQVIPRKGNSLKCYLCDKIFREDDYGQLITCRKG